MKSVSPRVRIVEVYEEAGASLTLCERDGELELVLGNVPLLTSRALETEHEFGALAKEATPGTPDVVVVGGLGFGSTLKGVLAATPETTRVVVVEKLRSVVRIAETHAARFFDGVLQNARVSIELADVADVIAERRGLRALLLDVDNGPGWGSFRTNAKLYGEHGISLAHTSLAPGGIFAVWSGYEERAFTPKLRRGGFVSRVVPLHEKGTVAARAYVGRKPP